VTRTTAGNRERLVLCAADLFHRRGFEAASLDELLNCTGIARSNLYYHFPSKLALGQAVIDHWLDVYERAIVAPALEHAGEGEAAVIRALFRHACTTQDPEQGRVGCPVSRLCTELAEAAPRVKEEVRAYFVGLELRLADAFAADPSREEARDTSTAEGTVHQRARRRAALVVAALEGALTAAGLHGDPRTLLEVGDTLAEVVAEDLQHA